MVYIQHSILPEQDPHLDIQHTTQLIKSKIFDLRFQCVNCIPPCLCLLCLLVGFLLQLESQCADLDPEVAAVLCAPGPSRPHSRQRSSSSKVLFVQHVKKCSLIEGGEGVGSCLNCIFCIFNYTAGHFHFSSDVHTSS